MKEIGGFIGILIGAVIVYYLIPDSHGGMVMMGANGGSAPAMLSMGTKGVAFGVIWIVEAVILKTVVNISFGRAIFGSLILNLFSSVAGVFLSLVAFSTPVMTWLCLAGLTFLTWRIYLRQERIPGHYTTILLFSFIIGTLAAYRSAYLIPPQSPFYIGLLMVMSMLTGYGIAVGLETLISGKLLGSKDSWQGVVLANLASFILLAFMIPYFPANIYDGNDDIIEPVVIQKISDGADADEITGIFTDYAASNSYLLGFSEDSKPVGPYWPGLEFDVINTAWSSENESYPDPTIALGIILHAESSSEFQGDSEEALIWARKYFGYWVNLLNSQESWDQAGHLSLTIEWTTWYQTTDVPSYFEDLPEPNSIIEIIN